MGKELSSLSNLDIGIEISPTWNYASYQADFFAKRENGSTRSTSFSFIKRVTVTNKGGSSLRDCALRFSIFPAYCSIDPIKIDFLEQGKKTEIDHFAGEIEFASLYALSTSLPGELTVDLVNGNGDIIASKKATFSFDNISSALYSSGVRELLASYVTPDDKSLQPIKEEAGLLLKDKYDSSFAGYSYRDPNKVIEEIDALYLALSNEKISLSASSSSPIMCLKNIDLPWQILDKKEANCVDFAILFASLIEMAALRPLIVFTGEKALVGVYLDESISSSPLLDNDTELLNLASKGFNRLILIDPVYASKEKNADFSYAVNEGYLALQNNHSFLYGVDIFASRKEHILPLPTPIKAEDTSKIEFPDFSAKKDYSMPRVEVENRRYLDSEAPSKKNKFDYWEEKLLDLSMNNRLINMRFSNLFPQVLNLDSEALLSTLSKTNKVSAISSIDISPIKEERNTPANFSNADKSRFNEYLGKKTLCFVSKEGSPDDYLKSLARKANTAIEESGCNPLFLTIGLIKWFDNEKAAAHGKGALYSPLFLLPVKMPRRKTGSSFSLEYNIDDLGLNTTIFEYFRENFDLDFSPVFGEFAKTSKNEPDIRLIFNFIRERIASFKGWAVLEEPCSVSLFSFARFVMWNDIKTHREKMMQNPLISSFVDGFNELETQNADSDKKTGDEAPSSSLAIPLPADSSQIDAIRESANGVSFILDGPPGTGKSQTIANMITNALYHGKSVLFVAEKGVALEVVKKRLDALGIGKFCLTIPSINTAKSEVLSSLGEMLELGQVESPQDFETQSSSVDEKRNKLNDDLYALHQKGTYVFSPYEAIINYLRLAEYKGAYETSKDYAASLTMTDFESAQKELTNLSMQASALGGYYGNSFLPFSSREYSIEARDSLFEKIPSLIADLKAFHIAVYNCFFKDKGLAETRGNVDLYYEIVKLLQDNSLLFLDYLSDETFVQKKQEMQGYLLLLGQKFKIKEELSELWEEGFFKESGETLLAKKRAIKRASLFEKHRLLISLKKSLKPLAKDKRALKKGTLEKSLEKLIEYRHLEEDAEHSDPYVRYVFSKSHISSSLDIENEIARYDRTLKIIDIKNGFRLEKQATMTDIDDAIRHLSVNREYLFAKARMTFISQYDALKEKLSELKEKFGFDLSNYEDCFDFYLHVSSSLTDAYSSKGKLSEWTNLLLTLDRVSKLVPEELVDSYRNGKIKEDALLSSYICSLSYRILSDSLSEKGLSTINAKDTKEEIASYKKAIDDFSKTSIVETVSRITSLYPSSSASAPSTTIYQFRKLIKNGGRGVSLRQIFDHFGTLVRTLCPCFLMSPASVAQYLDIDSYNFDLVIFDEASQIPTSEAVGAIARGKTTIIAGDQEQMPPSNFFMASGGHSSDPSLLSSMTEDLESLLDDAIALGLPRKRLTWHYRSRHESLIAFSNNKFYANSLITFPSPANEKASVSSVYVGGKYEMKRGVNRKEATAIVEEIIRRSADPVLSNYSIGVVTFNEAQQNLIEDLLDKKLPYGEGHKLGGEDIFVKNLENVQGDERDVILFSTTYAPKEDGKLSLNFGPLSREKGERRLNVAITRAREEMIVFTSMKPTDIDAEKAKNAGASYLRSFLLFAETGLSSLPNNIASRISLPSVSVADFIAKDLKKLGYRAETNIGSSSFKVDVAVGDNGDKNHYSLGVLVDGDSYCSSPTCRDRNIVEPGILVNLGWNLYWVWSVEYLDHPQEVIKNIVNAINNSDGNRKIAREGDSLFNDPITFAKKEIVSHPYAIPYSRRKLSPMIPEDFSNKATSARMLGAFIADVLHDETPISEKLLNERIKDAYGLSRIGSNVRDVINMALNINEPNKEIRGGTIFYWDKERKMEEYRYYRLNNEDNQREITDISFIELGNAIADILLEQGKMTTIDLCKQVNSLFGFSTLKEKSRKHLELALKANANQRLGITIEDGYASIKNKGQ